MKNCLIDISITVGCVVGVGFVCGNDCAVFFNSYTNVVIFALLFCIANVVIRLFCYNNKIDNLQALCDNCFGKLSNTFALLLVTCDFVVIVTLFASVNLCMNCFVGQIKLPLYSLLTAVVSAKIVSAKKATSVTNVVALVLAIICVVLCSFGSTATPITTDVSPIKPIVYALFGVTTSLGVITKLSATGSKMKIVVCSIISSLIIALLLVLQLGYVNCNEKLPTLFVCQNVWEKLLAVVTAIICTVTGVVSCSIPVLEYLTDVLCNTRLATFCTYCTALAFSMLGLDVIINVGYVFVAVVGVLLITKIGANKIACAQKYC